MLAQKLLAGTGGGFAYIGSVTKQANEGDGWNSPGEALDVLSLAQAGDLVVIAFTFRAGAESSWAWGGMEFTDVLDATDVSNPGAYVGYRVVQTGDANPYASGDLGDVWDDLTIVASVFRGGGTLIGSAAAFGGSGAPNPPAVTASAGLWVATGHLDDDSVTLTAPANYTLAASRAYTGGFGGTTTAIAYRIADLSSDNPGAFVGGSDEWRATTMAFN